MNRTKYFGVIGNRDYIKLNDERHPFWEFLDKQPCGWLTSIVYRRDDYPEDRGPMIFDCGAWSYKAEDRPVIGKNRVTPEWALDQYQEHCRSGDILIAPDHMLIDGVDLTSRRGFNTRSAKKFLEICPKEYTPMGCVHGVNGDERIGSAERLVDMGYTHIAIGGVAARAAQRSQVTEMITAIRGRLPDIYIHILGLSSPNFMLMWNEIGIQSCDGSSHFKQAFTGGAFFTHEYGRLIKWNAGGKRNGGETNAPLCECKACNTLREHDIDTRYYGSNQHNMGRAAHNMNMLMRAHEWKASASSLV